MRLALLLCLFQLLACLPVWGAVNRCSEAYQKELTLEQILEAQYKTTLTRKHIENGAINQAREFKKRSREMTVGYDKATNTEQKIYIFGKAYFEKGIEYVDYSEVIDAKILKRMSLTELFRQAQRSSFHLEVEGLNKRLLLPSQATNRKLELFRFSKWLDKDHQRLEVVSLFGQKRRITLEDAFRASLMTNRDEIVQIEIFYKNGGRGDLFYSESEFNPGYQGVAILVKKWPKVEGNEMVAERIDALLKKNLPILYMIGDRPYSAAAGQKETGIATSVRTRLDHPHEIKSVLLVTEETRADVIAHEGVHLNDYAQGLREKLIDRMKAADLQFNKDKIKKENKDLQRKLEGSYYYTIKLVLEHRAHAEQIRFIRTLIQANKITVEQYEAALEKAIGSFNKLYLAPFNKIIEMIQKDYPEIVIELQKLIRENTDVEQIPAIVFN